MTVVEGALTFIESPERLGSAAAFPTTMGASSSHHITSNRNNRNLTRADARSFRTRARENVGKGYRDAATPPPAPRRPKVYRDQRAPLRWRVAAFVVFVIIVTTFVYKLVTMWDWLDA